MTATNISEALINLSTLIILTFSGFMKIKENKEKLLSEKRKQDAILKSEKIKKEIIINF